MTSHSGTKNWLTPVAPSTQSQLKCTSDSRHTALRSLLVRQTSTNTSNLPSFLYYDESTAVEGTSGALLSALAWFEGSVHEFIATNPLQTAAGEIVMGTIPIRCHY
jgi:hypothetical protein